VNDLILILDTRDTQGFLFLFVRDMSQTTAAILNQIVLPLLDSYSTSLFLDGETRGISSLSGPFHSHAL
jgi:hypothetical protein